MPESDQWNGNDELPKPVLDTIKPVIRKEEEPKAAESDKK